MAWQKAIGYGRRNLVETTIGRYKHIIGPELRARSSSCQQGNVGIAVHVLNRMIRVARPIYAPSESIFGKISQSLRLIHATTPLARGEGHARRLGL